MNNIELTRGYKYALIGDSGSGKTHSAATLALCPGIEKVCYVFTEPSEATFNSPRFPQELKELFGTKIHMMRAQPTPHALRDIVNNTRDMEKLDYQGLCQLTAKGKVRQSFANILSCLENYKCEFSGQELGSLDSWPKSYALVLDSLSGLNSAILRLVVGTKVALAPGDYGSAMAQEKFLIELLCVSTEATVVLTSHLSREKDEVSGITTVTMDAIGSKLGPQLPPYFDEVILTRFDGESFYWSTVKRGFALKARLLPHSNKIRPDFREIYK